VTLAQAYARLGLDPRAATPADLRARWHALALDQHPDRGGDAWLFVELQRAHLLVKHDLEAPRSCWRCRGLGTEAALRRGVGLVSVPCSVCAGTGRVAGAERGRA
jgi:DnaJ-class molecular chaperone